MPHLAAGEAIDRPPIGIYRVVGRNDEAMTSSAYSSGLHRALEQIYRSAFWLSKARFADARQRLNATASLARGWDTYDAEPPNIVARELTARILTVLELGSLPPVRLTASVEGGIAISFIAGIKRAVIEIYNTGEVAAATYSNDGEPTVWELDEIDFQLRNTIAQIRVHLTA